MNAIIQNFGPPPVPLIPESAPFTAEQRAWLNGFLAGIYGGAMGGGANNTARYVGSAIGVTVVAVVATRPGLGVGPAALVAGWNDAVPVSVAFSLLGAGAVALCRPRRDRAEALAA